MDKDRRQWIQFLEKLSFLQDKVRCALSSRISRIKKGRIVEHTTRRTAGVSRMICQHFSAGREHRKRRKVRVLLLKNTCAI